MVVAKGAHAHDLYVAIDFDGKIRLDSEDDVQLCGILWVELQAVDPAYLRSSCVPHCRAGLEPTREGKISVKLCCGPSKSAAHGEHGAKQHGHGDEHEQTNERLLAFRLHHYPLFPAVLCGWGRSSVSICK